MEAMQDYRVNFHTVVEKFDTFWGDRAYQKGSGWKQFKRWEYLMGQRSTVDGVRPNLRKYKTKNSCEAVIRNKN